MSEAAIRTAVYNAVNGVANKGVCYDYERWSATWDAFLSLFKTTVSGTPQIRGWMVVYAGQQAIRDRQFERFVQRQHTYEVHGFMGVDDSAATEKTFSALAEDVCDALDASGTIHSSTYIDASPATLATFEARTFGGTLCHYARITLTVTEQVS